MFIGASVKIAWRIDRSIDRSSLNDRQSALTELQRSSLARLARMRNCSRARIVRPASARRTAARYRCLELARDSIAAIQRRRPARVKRLRAISRRFPAISPRYLLQPRHASASDAMRVRIRANDRASDVENVTCSSSRRYAIVSGNARRARAHAWGFFRARGETHKCIPIRVPDNRERARKIARISPATSAPA
jgi:hypothetical protein